MNNNTCVQCRADRKTVVITTDTKKSFEELDQPNNIVEEVPQYGFRFDNEDVYKNTMELLKFHCSYPDCDFVADGGWPKLQQHTQKEHFLKLCSCCIEHKKAFTTEFELYTNVGLKAHEDGEAPGEYGFKGHPVCTYDNQRFYSTDEYMVHLKKNHEDCFICNRERPDVPRFFRDYSFLEKHFANEHYMCKEPACIETKFVVFASAVELDAHIKSEHSEKYGGRKLDLGYTLQNDNDRRRRNGRQRSNLSTISAEPSSSGSNSAGGVQISRGEAFPVLGSSSGPNGAPTSLTTNSSTWTITPEMTRDADLRLRERVRIILKNDPLKFSEFDRVNEEFLMGDKSAYDLLEQYRLLFPELTVEELEGVVVGFIKVIITQAEKVKELSRAWEEYRIRMHLPDAKGSLANSFGWGGSSSKSTSSLATGPWSSTPVRKNLSRGNQSSFPSLPTPAGSSRGTTYIGPTRVVPPQTNGYSSVAAQSRRNVPGAGPSLPARNSTPKTGSNSGVSSRSYASISGPYITGTNSSSSSNSSNVSKNTITSTDFGPRTAHFSSASSTPYSLGSANWGTTGSDSKKNDSPFSNNNNYTSSPSSYSSPSSASSSHIDLSSFPSLPATNKRFNAPLTNPLAGTSSISAAEDVIHATNLLRESRISNDNSSSSTLGAADRKGKKKKEKKVLISYGV